MSDHVLRMSTKKHMQHVSARLPSELVRALDRAAQEQLRTRSKQLAHELQRCYTAADSNSQPPLPKESKT